MLSAVCMPVRKGLDPEAVRMGQRLKALREDLGFTQAEVAERLDASANGYAHYEQGRVKISSVDLPLLAKALGISELRLVQRLGIVPEEDRPAVNFPQEEYESLTPEEQQDVWDFIRFRRQQRAKRGQ